MSRLDRRTFIGVDPGVNGGIAVLRGPEVIATAKHHTDPWVTREFIQAHANGDYQVGIEAVPKWCGEARFAIHAMTGSAMATMFGTFQLAVGICVGLSIQPMLIAPVKWQNRVECRNRERLETTAWKNKLKARARELYPNFDNLTLWNSDAVLIAHATRIIRDSG